MLESKSMLKILEFKGEFAFLSNFYSSPFSIAEKRRLPQIWPTVEHFYQAKKAVSLAVQQEIRRAPTPGKAKQMGRRIDLRSDWETVKDSVMFLALVCKFSQNGALLKMLLATGNAPLQEGNVWGDTYWGLDLKSGVGRNKLGKMLMEIRSIFKYGIKE